MRTMLAKLVAVMVLSAHPVNHPVTVLYPGPGGWCGQTGLFEARSDRLRVIRPVDCDYWGDGRYAPVELVYGDESGVRFCWDIPRSAAVARIVAAVGGRVVLSCPRGLEPYPVFGTGIPRG